MNESKKLLSSVLHTTQMGQTGIRSVRKNALDQDLCKELQRQLAQYDAIEKEALLMAKARGWKLTNVNPAVRKMSDVMSRMRLMGGDSDSKIAGMLIQGNTRGVILGVRDLHKSSGTDEQVFCLAQRLVDAESINIQKAQPYL